MRFVIYNARVCTPCKHRQYIFVIRAREVEEYISTFQGRHRHHVIIITRVIVRWPSRDDFKCQERNK